MGQRALGILYGSEMPNLPNDEDGDAPYDLIRRWENYAKVDRSSRQGPRIRCERESSKELIGVWVAVGGSGEDDAPYLVDEAMRLADVEDAFGKQIKIAEKLWKKFAAWAAKKEAVKLPEPTLWLTPCEVA